MEYSVSVEQLSEVGRSINIAIPQSAVSTRFEQALGKTTREARVKGFRPGKAPRKVIEKLYGSALRRDVVDDIWKEAYERAVEEHALEVVGLSDIRFENEEAGEKDLKVVVEVEILPRPQIRDYLGVECEVEEEHYDDMLVQRELDELQRRFTDAQPIVDRTTVALGDLVQYSFKATVNGKAFEGSQRDNVYTEIGTEEFEQQLIGMEVGSQKEFSIHYAESFANPEVAGKDVLYRVQVVQLFNKVVPELNDEFVKAHNLAENLSALRERVAEDVKRRLARRSAAAREDAVFKAIAAKNPFAVPQTLIDGEIREMLFELGALDRSKTDARRVSVEGFRESLGAQAELRVRKGIITEQLIAKEGVEPSDEEVSVWLENRAAEYGIAPDVLRKSEGMRKRDQLKAAVRRDGVIRKVMDSAKIGAVVKEGAEKKAPKKKAKQGA